MMASTPLAILFLLAASFSVYELVRLHGHAQVESYIADREAQATHVLMNGGMAAMFAPFYDPSIERIILVFYAIGAAVLALRFIAVATGTRRTQQPNRAAGSAYHLFGLAAMLYAIKLMPMSGHGAMIMPVAPPSWTAILLGVVFLLDGVATLVLAGFMPRALLRMERSITGETTIADPPTLALIRASAFPHVVMDLGMAVMLHG